MPFADRMEIKIHTNVSEGHKNNIIIPDITVTARLCVIS